MDRMLMLRKSGWLTGPAPLLALLLLLASAADASNFLVQDLHHSAWTAESGLGAVFDIQQSRDGFLWLTTSRGVLRFDGVRFQTVREVTNGAVDDDDIFSAFVPSSGGVWLTTRSAGLLRWKDGRLAVYPDRRCTPAAQIGMISEDLDGSLWIRASAGLARLRGSSCEAIGADRGYPGGLPLALLVDRAGTVWVKSPTGMLVTLPRGHSNFQPTPYNTPPTSHLAFLHQAPDGVLWISDEQGIHPLAKPLPARVTHPPGQTAPFRDFTFTPAGSVWAVALNGIQRFDHLDPQHPLLSDRLPSNQEITPAQGLTSNAVWTIFIDREASIWVGTNGGLDRLRQTPLTSLTLPHFPSGIEDHEFSIAAAADGSAWTGNSSLPLTRVAPDGEAVSYPRTRQTICVRRDRNGVIWSAGEGDVPLWRSSGTSFVPVHYPDDKLDAVISLAVDRNNEPWLSTVHGVIYHLTGDTWVRQNELLRRKPGVVGAMTGDDAGNIWLGFSNNLVRWNGQAYQRWSFPENEHGVSMGTLAVRGDHVWMAGRGGIDLFAGGRFYRMRFTDENQPGRVSGIVETAAGDLWINGFSGISHIPAPELARWLRNPASRIAGERLDTLDGLPGLSAERLPEPSLVESPQGRLWFATTRGIAYLDPARLESLRNRAVPPVAVTSLLIDGKRYPATAELTLPRSTQTLQIDYTALSLAIPERVLFRYKLEGVDKDWQQVGTRRQAFYTSLPPGHYRFRVLACNNDGLWNESGATIGLSLQPVGVQTWWFKTLCVIALAIFIWIIVRLRIRSITLELRQRLAERLAERERIARELHDTLLQSLVGLILRFQIAIDRMPSGDPVRDSLEEALAQSEKVMHQGRERVRDLRVSQTDSSSLTDALTTHARDLQASHPGHFELWADGRPRLLDAIVQEEILFIAREALTNAFTHSGARNISVTAAYLSDELRLTILDDGRGIDQEILTAGSRTGHWGFPGMRERATRLRCDLKVSSPRQGGTRVELRVPAAIAYRPDLQAGRRAFNPFRRPRRRPGDLFAD
jgi:signal transduction histidine kinase/ligand-binding sensor domain-containing protein